MRETLNQSSLTIEEAENRIRIIARDAHIFQESEMDTQRKVNKVIAVAVERIPIERLRGATQRSLYALYKRCRAQMRYIRPDEILLILAIRTLTRQKPINGYMMPMQTAKEYLQSVIPHTEVSINLGNAAQKFMGDYMKDVSKTLERLSREVAIDPDSKRHFSLRNRAEIETRAEQREQDKQALIDSGVRLVIISSHADCSERCRPFQGRVFSLDGTSGRTPDGRPYEPLENATEIYVNGWKNGLFGFNCRHYMTAYRDGYRPQQVPAAIERREYAVTQKQRAYERKVREWRAKAESYKGIDPAKYSYSRKKAIEWNKKYIEYSRGNNRAYFPSRTKLL